MTLTEWTAEVKGELEAAGYAVSVFKGFPLVQCPATIEAGARLLEFKTTLAADRNIFHEGLLFTPAGFSR